MAVSTLNLDALSSARPAASAPVPLSLSRDETLVVLVEFFVLLGELVVYRQHRFPGLRENPLKLRNALLQVGELPGSCVALRIFGPSLVVHLDQRVVFVDELAQRRFRFTVQGALLTIGLERQRHTGAHFLEHPTLRLQPFVVGGVVDGIGVGELLELAPLAFGEALPVLIERTDLEGQGIPGAHVLLELPGEGGSRLADGGEIVQVACPDGFELGEPGHHAFFQSLYPGIVGKAGCVMLLYPALLVDAAVARGDAIVDGVNLPVEGLPRGIECRLSAGSLGLEGGELLHDARALGFVVFREHGLPRFEIFRECGVVGLEGVLEALHHHVVDRAVVDFLRRRCEGQGCRHETNGAETDGVEQ